MASTFTKDPDAVLDYVFDWKAETNGTGDSDWLDTSETISSHTITVDSGITKDSDSESGGQVTVWLSGGSAGVNYDVSCKIVTSAGRTDERTTTIEVRER